MNRRSAGNERNLLVNTQNVPRRRTNSEKLPLASLLNSSSDEDNLKDLAVGLRKLELANKLVEEAAETQRKGMQKLHKWASKSRNAAIDDVMSHTKELFELKADKTRQWAHDDAHFVREFSKIIETSKNLEKYEDELRRLEAEERKIKKQLRKSSPSLFWSKKGGDLVMLQQKYNQVVAEREDAERELKEKRAEAEVINMYIFRRAMTGMSDSYRNLGKNYLDIFTCQREITEMVPSVVNQDVNRMIYEGIPYTRERVQELRRSLDNEIPLSYNPPSARRRSDEPMRNRGRSSNRQGTPPPPYSPNAHPAMSDPIPAQRNAQQNEVGDETPRRPHLVQHIPRFTPRTNPSRHPAVLRQSVPPNPNAPSNNNRLYPQLSPNPYAMLKNFNASHITNRNCVNSEA
uniref:Uncharacterized protein n=1 Tax=Acrobeloides nanus TaxID=290746 RepID=A0A914DG08_9BILA